MNGKKEHVKTEGYDVVVAGGGMAGVCAAIAAARLGVRTALIQDRPVLGGNASSEMRVWMVGATAMGRNRYAAETGIIGELDLENLYRNPQGNPYIWDSILLDFVMHEKNITLYLNTTVLRAYEKNSRLESLIAYQMTTETELEIHAAFFIDCTGDGRVGFLAGVPFFQGQEERGRFHESLAPEKSEPVTLGSTLLLYTRDTGHAVKYHAPDFAYGIEYIHKLITENEKSLSLETNGCDFWWIEVGGEGDTIAEGDVIRAELQKLVYGIWNYIKNSGLYSAETWELEWVGSLPARRESRRMEGAYTLTQNDILQHKTFPDAVCGGGWPIDTHPPGGIYSKKEACEQRDAGVYQIPLRCLYTQKLKNLFLAGRDLSASHLAFASARVMKTCAVMGQAAGAAAALCARWKTLPAGLSDSQMFKLQQELLWDDQWIPGVNYNREVRATEIKASGFSRFENEMRDTTHRLDEDLWIMLSALPECKGIQFYLNSDVPCLYEIECLCGTQRNACNDMAVLGTAHACLEGKAQWVEFQFEFSVPEDRDLFLRLPAAAVELAVSRTPVCGCVGSIGGRTGLRLVNPCFRLNEASGFFAPEQAFTAFTRPTFRPNQWVSRPLSKEPAWLQCSLDILQEEKIEMQVIFDTDLNRDYNQLRPNYYGNGWNRMPPQLARNFRILASPDAKEWRCAATYRDYHRRFCRLKIPEKMRYVRVETLSTWGAPCASIFAIQFRAVSTDQTDVF